MNDSFVATSLDVSGAAIRYATVERPSDSQARLMDGGVASCPFNAAQDLLQADAPAHQEALHDALRTAFGTPDRASAPAPDAFSIVVHPSDLYAFFTPLAVDSSVSQRKRELRQRAALLTQIRDIDTVRLHAKTVRTSDQAERNGRLMWVHVMAVPHAVEQRVHALADALGFPAPQWTVSTEAVVPVVSRIELQNISHEDALRPYALAIGIYPCHTEYALTSNRNWYHSHVAMDAETTDDRAYYAVSMLNRLQISPQSVGRIFVYGSGSVTDPSVFEAVFDRSPTPLSLDAAFDTSACEWARGAEASAFAACCGATLLS